MFHSLYLKAFTRDTPPPSPIHVNTRWEGVAITANRFQSWMLVFIVVNELHRMPSHLVGRFFVSKLSKQQQALSFISRHGTFAHVALDVCQIRAIISEIPTFSHRNKIDTSPFVGNVSPRTWGCWERGEKGIMNDLDRFRRQHGPRPHCFIQTTYFFSCTVCALVFPSFLHPLLLLFQPWPTLTFRSTDHSKAYFFFNCNNSWTSSSLNH